MSQQQEQLQVLEPIDIPCKSGAGSAPGPLVYLGQGKYKPINVDIKDKGEKQKVVMEFDFALNEPDIAVEYPQKEGDRTLLVNIKGECVYTWITGFYVHTVKCSHKIKATTKLVIKMIKLESVK